MHRMTPPATLPADAIGFVARHPERPERLALWHRDGSLSNWFARDLTREAIAAILATYGFRLADDDSVTREAQ